MKKFILFIVSLFTTGATFADNTSDIQSATLIHGDQTTVFYTANALIDAYEAAIDGDKIILSPGGFETSDISYAGLSVEKSISIYGAGYETDPVSGAMGTVLRGPVLVSEIKSYDEYGKETYSFPMVYLEGISFDSFKVWGNTHGTVLSDLNAKKCKFSSFDIGADTKDCTFSQCVFTNSFFSQHTTPIHHETLTFENCHIGGRSYSQGDDYSSNILFDHCIIKLQSTYDGIGLIANYTNCILYNMVPEYSTVHNNIFPNHTGLSGYDIHGSGNWFNIANVGIYAAEGEDGSYGATKDFALKFPKAYVGTDGTEVGINGGRGFNRISSIPRITSSQIDTRATEGKINVSITVEAQSAE